MAYVMRPMAMTPVFLNRMFTVFFACVSPLSRHAKPRCMMKTRNVATSIQVLLTVNSSCEAVSWANTACGMRTMASSTSDSVAARTIERRNPVFIGVFLVLPVA